MTEEWTGGCACGVVRYRLASDPYEAGWCHCRTCQLSSGSPAIVFATVPITDFCITHGEDLVGQFASSDFGYRRFCTRCGTPLMMHVDHEPDTVDFTVATLDEPDRLPPTFRIFYASRIDWAPAGDDLPRYDRLRPDVDKPQPGTNA